MGILNFALSGNYKDFYAQLKELSKTNHKSPVLMFLDTAFSTLLFGSGLQDYLNYKFYNKSLKERSTYVTIGNMAKAYKTLAAIEYADFISNKANFHKNYSKFTKRDFCTPDDSFEKFQEFVNKHPVFVTKPQRGLGGSNVKKVSKDEIPSLEDFYNKMKEDEIFVEELVIQDEKWGALSPDSINTLRIMTTVVNENVKIIFGAARIGSGKTIADNFHQGGQGVLIDLETGKLKGNGIDKKLNENEKSITGITFDGFDIPYWEEIKKMVKEAALINPNIHIVGWDVSISKNGPLIIEGNRGPGFDLVQVLLNKGTKYMLDDLQKELKKSFDSHL